ncbi:MAG: DUF1015 family protein [Acidimicrobiales bacterium]
MPRFEPFAGLRYSLSHIRSLEDVVCPPYDVISEEKRLALLERSASNVVRLELPVDDGSGDPYERAALLLDSWRDGGILRRDPVPAFYGCRMSHPSPAGGDRVTIGVVGALGLEPPGDGILPHEHTTPKAKSDRLDLIRATRANLSPIWALTPGARTPGSGTPGGGLAELCDPPAHPAEHARDDEGVLHELWPILDRSRQVAISELVGEAPVLIADGHHRFETALAYREEQRAAGTATAGDDFVMAFVVELAPQRLSVQGIHRLIAGLPEGTDVVGALSRYFELSPTERPDPSIETRMAAAGSLALVTSSGTWLARPTLETAAAAQHDLDSSRLDVALSALPQHELRYQHGWESAVAELDSGRAQAVVLVRPATVEQIAEISRGGERMPPKTTFFWPKPRTGLVIRELLA